MRSVASLFLACVIITTLPISQTNAATIMLSNGLDGAFAPSASIQLTPDGDGTFNFTTIDIAEQVLISFDRSAWESGIYLLATGDVNIYGALNTGPGPLHIQTPGVVTLGGKIYGQTITLAGEEVHYINNPNGNPDLHLFGGVYATIQPDGELEFSMPDPLLGIDARDLTGGFFGQMDTAPSEVPLEARYFEPPGTMLLQTPLPPAVWLLLSAIAVAAGFGRNKKQRPG